jgi:hypothetical protein
MLELWFRRVLVRIPPLGEVTGMISRTVSAIALVAALGAAACGSSATPASPSPTPVVDASLAGAASVAASGVIGDLNLRTGTFTLASRGGSRVIRVDDRTQVWSARTRIRVSSLQNGLNADVRGTDQGRYIQAASISVSR